MEIKKPKYEQPKYPTRPQSLVRRIFAEELNKHRNKTKAQCIQTLKENGLMGLVPKSIKEDV